VWTNEKSVIAQRNTQRVSMERTQKFSFLRTRVDRFGSYAYISATDDDAADAAAAEPVLSDFSSGTMA
jgi:hypothetical protein